jgi:sulfonate dioxygenase
VHPVTGEKALYVNKGFTRYIVGYKQEESDYLLNFLYGTLRVASAPREYVLTASLDHIAKGTDFQVRASYEPGTVVLWDNRLTVHTHTGDWDKTTQRRHAIRLTPQAEAPIPA